MNRYETKAQTLVAAWTELFGARPSFVAMVNAMSVAELETRMGDAWPGEHNWGAVMKRPLSAEEAETLRSHGISAAGGEPAVTAARQLLAPGPNEALHRDTSPGKGPFFAWFWSFPTELEAAKKFLQVLVRGRVRAIIGAATPDELARAMYEAHYYEGFHANDPEANIRDYAAALRRHRAAIERGLGASPAPSPPLPSERPSRLGGAGLALVLFGVFLAIRWTPA